MTRLELMARAAWERRDARYSGEFSGHDWDSVGDAIRHQLVSDMRAAVEALLARAILDSGAPPGLTDYLRGILTEHAVAEFDKGPENEWSDA